MSWRAGIGFVVLFACVAAFVWWFNVPRAAPSPRPPAAVATPVERVSSPTKLETPAPPAVEAEEDLAPATPRGPFRLSESIVRACKRPLALGECLKLDDFLEQMRGEPRDERWAARAEALFEKAIREEGRGAFHIRALECRRSRCAVEYDSETGDMNYWSQIDSLDLFPRYSTFAHEHDPQTGILVRVEVNAWQSNETFTADDLWEETRDAQ